MSTGHFYTKVRTVVETESFQKAGRLAADLLFPFILLIFPLLKADQGIDLTDTGYSLGNYRFFGETGGVWTFLTYLSNVTGFWLTKLPMGHTMLGMKIYTSLAVSLLALLGYRFFKTKMPPWLAFLGEIAAIGFSWCPTVILYNYLTYLLLLAGAVLLFRGLAGCRPPCLFLAGILLGLNGFVRFPNNILEIALIVAVWYYGALKRKDLKTIARETGLCAAGYLAAFLVMIGILSISYGTETFGEMIAGVFGMAGSASDYTLGEMLLTIFDAYFRGFQWMLYMILCVLPGIPFLVINGQRFLKIRKVIYCVCIPVLFWVLGKWGMYNFRYYQKESALQWGAVFLLLALAELTWMLFTRMLDDEWRLIGCIGLVLILIGPLGSNNHIWPVLNNLFFITPIVFWMVYRLARWGRTYMDITEKVPLFPVKAMMSGILIAFFIQTVGIGCFYVFRDGEMGEERIYKVTENHVLKGMYTSELNSEILEEISIFMTENSAQYAGKELILYGNIPGISYYLDKPPAIDTAWADLNTYPVSRLKQELEEISHRPLVILTPQIASYLSGDEAHMQWWGVDKESYDRDEKLKAIWNFMQKGAYEQVFANEAFVIYQ